MKLTSLLIILASLLGAINGYFYGHNFAVSRSPYWKALVESNESNSETLELLRKSLTQIRPCEAGRAALAQGGE